MRAVRRFAPRHFVRPCPAAAAPCSRYDRRVLSRRADPIVAIATAPGRGAVGIVRLSGTDLQALALALCGRALVPRQATLLALRAADGSAIDQGLALYFPAPHSYTGEDVLELQAHGGAVLLQILLARCLEAGQGLGLRVAEPGEFTQRAFLNGKLDLVQAEAVADLIDASTESAARSAGRALGGVFSQQVDALREQMVRLRMLVEATLDFPEEEIDFLQQTGALQQLQQLGVAAARRPSPARRCMPRGGGLRVACPWERRDRLPNRWMDRGPPAPQTKGRPVLCWRGGLLSVAGSFPSPPPLFS